MQVKSLCNYSEFLRVLQCHLCQNRRKRAGGASQDASREHEQGTSAETDATDAQRYKKDHVGSVVDGRQAAGGVGAAGCASGARNELLHSGGRGRPEQRRLWRQVRWRQHFSRRGGIHRRQRWGDGAGEIVSPPSLHQSRYPMFGMCIPACRFRGRYLRTFWIGFWYFYRQCGAPIRRWFAWVFFKKQLYSCCCCWCVFGCFFGHWSSKQELQKWFVSIEFECNSCFLSYSCNCWTFVVHSPFAIHQCSDCKWVQFVSWRVVKS